jgi:hypothetical protein
MTCARSCAIGSQAHEPSITPNRPTLMQQRVARIVTSSERARDAAHNWAGIRWAENDLCRWLKMYHPARRRRGGSQPTWRSCRSFRRYAANPHRADQAYRLSNRSPARLDGSMSFRSSASVENSGPSFFSNSSACSDNSVAFFVSWLRLASSI